MSDRSPPRPAICSSDLWLIQNALAKPDKRRRRRHRLPGALRLGGARLHVVPHVEARVQKLAAGGDAARMNAKLVTGRFFMERMLPSGTNLERIKAGRRA